MGHDLAPRTTPADTTGIGRFDARALLGWATVVVGLVPFLLLWLLVQQTWSPLAGLDGEVAADLNDALSGSPMLVSLLSAVTTWVALRLPYWCSRWPPSSC